MDIDFWLQKWREGETGFHKDRPHEWLVRYWKDLNVEPGLTVLVPLCGKSLDMLYLANLGYRLIGIEASQLAIKDFFKERGLEPSQHAIGSGYRWEAGPYTILESDFFQLDARETGEIHAVYDRAAFVALPELLRQRYVDQLVTLTGGARPTLLITFEYSQQFMAGPPFSICRDEIEQKYGRRHVVHPLDRHKLEPVPDHLVAKGAQDMWEAAYLNLPKSP